MLDASPDIVTTAPVVAVLEGDPEFEVETHVKTYVLSTDPSITGSQRIRMVVVVDAIRVGALAFAGTEISKNLKLYLRYTRGITVKHATNSGTHLRDLAHG